MAAPKLLGFNGFARSGKDTIAAEASHVLVENGVANAKTAFADPLKRDLNKFLMDKFGISAWTKDDGEKVIIRPMMVGYGEARRLEDPDYWVKMAQPFVDECIAIGVLPIITDVRYVNEVKWVQSMGGKVINISREDVTAPNDSEAKNQPLVDKVVDFSVNLPYIEENDTRNIKINQATAEALSALGFEINQ